MKNTIDPKKAIAIIGAVSVLIIGGYILGYHILGNKEDSLAAAVISPRSSAEATYDYKIDSLPDGIVGKDKATPIPKPSDNPEDTTPLPGVKASAAPTSNSNGSYGSGTAPSNAPSPAANSGSSSSGSTPATGSTNSSGQFYVPGFGYVTPGGPGAGQVSGSDGDINKQVGTMG